MPTPLASTVAAALLVALTAGCALEPAGVRPPEAEVLSVEELRGVIERAAAEGRAFDDGYDGGLTFTLHLDGQMKVRSRFVARKAIAGRWRIDADGARLCTRIESDPEHCARVYRFPGVGGRYYLDVAGGTQKANTFVLR